MERMIKGERRWRLKEKLIEITTSMDKNSLRSKELKNKKGTESKVETGLWSLHTASEDLGSKEKTGVKIWEKLSKRFNEVWKELRRAGKWEESNQYCEPAGGRAQKDRRKEGINLINKSFKLSNEFPVFVLHFISFIFFTVNKRIVKVIVQLPVEQSSCFGGSMLQRFLVRKLKSLTKCLE